SNPLSFCTNRQKDAWGVFRTVEKTTTTISCSESPQTANVSVSGSKAARYMLVPLALSAEQS
ncbi:MAG: hypothetical protein U0L92_04145, partial [Clostridia bacterium]|nr:hypothetical protein [Clostridia bacterium]